MIFGGTSTRILASSLTTVYYIGQSQIKTTQKSYRSIWTPWGEWAVENGMAINPGKSKAIRFTRARGKNPLGYSHGDKIFGSEQW
jgi:hypothetical protein